MDWGKKAAASRKKFLEPFPKNYRIANPSKVLQCDKNPICASFPTTVLTVSGSRVKAFAYSQPIMLGSPKIDLWCDLC